MHSNFLYRFHVCGLSIEETAELTGRSSETVKKWDKGRDIPIAIKKLMAYHCGLNGPSSHPDWQGWRMRREYIVTPEDQYVNQKDLRSALYLLQLERSKGKHVKHKKPWWLG